MACILLFVLLTLFVCLNHPGNIDLNCANISQGSQGNFLAASWGWGQFFFWFTFSLRVLCPLEAQLEVEKVSLLSRGGLLPVTLCLALWCPGNGNSRSSGTLRATVTLVLLLPVLFLNLLRFCTGRAPPFVFIKCLMLLISFIHTLSCFLREGI